MIEKDLTLVVVKLEAVAKVAVKLYVVIIYDVRLLNLGEGLSIIS